MPRRPLLLAAVLAAALGTLSGCDQLGIEAASVTAARIDADGKAVGAACRNGGRAIEDCFTLNRKVDKGAIYAGWREMDDYMRENKIEAVAPTLGPDPKPAKTADADAPSDAASAAAPKVAKADKSGDKAVDKPAAKGDKPLKVDKLADKAVDKPADKTTDKSADTGARTAAVDADKAAAPH